MFPFRWRRGPAATAGPDVATSAPAGGPAASPELRALLMRVEGLGDNCELGLYLEAAGLTRGFLLRFALVSIEDLTRFVGAADRRAFAFEDLVPYSKAMVRDRATGIAFHSKVRSVRAGAGWRFETCEAERRELYGAEKSKHDFLLERFERTLVADEPRVYAIKANAGLSDERVAALDAALRAHRSPQSYVLLVVEAGGDANADASGVGPDAPVALDRRSDTVRRAHIPRLAPYHEVGTLDVAAWHRTFEALALDPKVRDWAIRPADRDATGDVASAA